MHVWKWKSFLLVINLVFSVCTKKKGVQRSKYCSKQNITNLNVCKSFEK